MVKFILIKSPDEWATTNQACRDELVVYLSFSAIYTKVFISQVRPLQSLVCVEPSARDFKATYNTAAHVVNIMYNTAALVANITY